MKKVIKTKEKFVIIENYLFEGWLAIEGDENDKLITYDSCEEAENELKSEDIFMIMNQILDPIFIKFYEEKEITDLLDYAIFEKYIQSMIENNPLLQVLKEKSIKFFDYATNRIKEINTKLDKIRIEILKKKK